MEFQNFPQPTRPTSYSNLTSFKYATSITQPSEPSTSTSNRQQRGDDEDELFGELTRILVECLDIVDNVPKGLLLRKIFSELEKESEMENFIVEMLKHSHVKAISDFLERYQESSLSGQVGEDDQQARVISRGFKEDLMEASMTSGSKPGLLHKLERFKVKTINLEGGVIKK